MAADLSGRNADFRPTSIALSILVIGHLGLLVSFPGGLSWQGLLAVETSALVVLAGAELLSGLSALAVVRLAIVYTTLVASTWLTLSSTDSLFTASLVLLTGVGLVAYGLHRYELVFLGLVEAPDEQ